MTGIDDALRAPGGWLPIAFLAIMGLAMLAYVVLDGYDLGVGVLMGAASDADKDTMIARKAIGSQPPGARSASSIPGMVRPG